ILDSGSSWNSLPSAILVNLASELGATYSQQLQGYVLKNCDLQFQSGTINFSFGSAIIRVPFDEMIVNVEDSNGNPITYKNGQPVCQIGALVSNTDFVLGDTFLRSAYVVYDLDNNEIGIAQTKFNTTDSAIVALGSTNAGIPNSRAASSVPTITSGANVSNARPSSVVDGSATITVNASAPRGKSAAFSLKILSLFQIALVVIGITTANILCI
ncbi:putative aspartic-type endopeptidase opsB, partial [Neolecta irregularis DAH-3]